MDPIHVLETNKKAKLDQAEALSNKPGATAEELAQADALLAEAEAIDAQLKTRRSQEHRLGRINAVRASTPATPAPTTLAVTPTETPATPGGAGATGATLGGNLPAVPRSYGQLRAFKGADGDRLAYAFGAWCLGLTNHPAAQHFRQLATQVAPEFLAMSVNVPTAGGYLVPEAVGMLINQLRLQYGVMRNAAENVPMGDAEIVKSPIILTGTTVYAAGEGQERTASDLGFGDVELISRDWAILSKFSNKLAGMASVLKLGDTIAQDMAYQFSVNEDTCCFNGDGSATYQGIQGIKPKLAAGSVYTAATGHTSFGALTLADFVGVTAKMPNYVGAQPRWFISKQGWALSMQPLAITTGYLDPTNPVKPAFLGYPVEFVEVLPQTAAAQVSTVVALFGDMRLAAKFGDRETMRLATSDQRYFEFDQTAVKAESSFAFNAYRVGTSTAAGPVVALKTPAS